VHILRELGCNLVYPEGQTCCGQPAFNSGYGEETVPPAERFMKIFSDAEYIVAPSGSCVSMVKNGYGDLAISPKFKDIWQEQRKRIYEFSQFLTDVLKVREWGGYFPARVTYHDSCHGLRELGISGGPRELLKSIGGLEYIEMFRPDTCCGFGGTFSVKFGEISTAMAENKARWIQESGAEYVVACDSSCLMHLEGYFKRQGIPVKTIHLAEVLWRARREYM
jgi:L-lactate dehydrogenase complex protein LldE